MFPTGLKDIDREILLKLYDDKELLSMCNDHKNKYLFKEVCNEGFFHSRLLQKYPDTLEFKPDNISYKRYFLRVVFRIAKLKEVYGYEYVSGNPKIQYAIFRQSKRDNIQSLMMNSALRGDLTLLKYTVDKGADIHEQNDYALVLAINNGHLEIVKYLVEKRAVIRDSSLRYRNQHLEVVKYLKSIVG